MSSMSGGSNIHGRGWAFSEGSIDLVSCRAVKAERAAHPTCPADALAALV